MQTMQVDLFTRIRRQIERVISVLEGLQLDAEAETIQETLDSIHDSRDPKQHRAALTALVSLNHKCILLCHAEDAPAELKGLIKFPPDNPGRVTIQ